MAKIEKTKKTYQITKRLTIYNYEYRIISQLKTNYKIPKQQNVNANASQKKQQQLTDRHD